MRLPIHVPEAADARRPMHQRLATLGVATALAASAALASPLSAFAEETQAVDVETHAAAEGVPAEETAAPTEEPEPAGPAEAPALAEEPTVPAEAPMPVEESVPAAKVAAEASGAGTLAAQAPPTEAGAEPANQLPVAVDDHYQVLQNTTLVVGKPGYRINDYDPEGDWYGVSHLEPYLPAEWSGSHDGSFTYTPPAGFTGTRVFQYWLRDGAGELSEPATITIEVLPTGSEVDEPPIANDDTYSYALNTPLFIAAPGVLANDVDPDGDALTVSLRTGPGQGTITLNPDGSFLYTPKADVGGTYWFEYRVCDASSCADAEAMLHQVAAGGTPSGPSQPPAAPGEPQEPGEPAEPAEHEQPGESEQPEESAGSAEPTEPGRPAEEQAPLDDLQPAGAIVRSAPAAATDAAALALTGSDPRLPLALAALLAALGLALQAGRRRAAER